jgi:NTP pyrophosphatase (non-canonical NTP hydrolase)
MTDIIDINKFKQTFSEFVQQRDWDQVHNPKNIAMALTVEAAELLEIFQWLSPEEAQNAKNNPVIKEKISHELADIMIYLIRLSDKAEINLQRAIIEKMELNAQKYPATLVKGCNKKYNEYQ